MALFWDIEILRVTYLRLQLTKPFKRWRLPSAEEVVFHIIANKTIRGDWSFEGGRHKIRISNHVIHTTRMLDATMAHEMCHIRQHELGDRSEHGKIFLKLADQVCRHHEYERGMF